MKKFSTPTFDGEAETFRLVTEALAIKFAHMVTPCLAVHTSPIEPLPHQISAVYEKMLPRRPLRFLLADDPGAGKTVMTGLLIKEKIFRGELRNCLIVCPAALVEQWQDELRQKFRLDFEILSDENFHAGNFFVAGIDKLVHNKNLREKLFDVSWDLVVCDEAHKMSATVQGNKVHYTKRFKLGQRLGKISRNFLLLTATPHNGKPKDFYQFMSLLDAERFLHAQRIDKPVDTSDLMRRLVKEDLLTFDGKPLFPERRAFTVKYKLSPQEKNLYELVTAYVADGFNRAEKLKGNKKFSVGFVMTILQRRLASSPPAIFNSLTRRTQRLQEIFDARKLSVAENFDAEDLDEYEDFSDRETERLEDELSERVTAAENLDELRREIETLKNLSAAAEKVLLGGVDRKWLELSALLDGKNFPRNEKLIIFTEHRDTLEYLREKISARLGEKSVVTIHGGLSPVQRRRIQDNFRRDEKISVLVATDAAGEGINLQVAHLMINYDLPWNPNRLEQRFGRIHRIGQKKICCVWNLVADDTREGKVFLRLLEKLSAEKSALGGKVFDVLGKISFDNKPLRELLTAAIRDGDKPAAIRQLNKIVDKSFDAENLRKLFDDPLQKDTFNLDAVKKIRSAGKDNFRPQFVENFFVAAFNKLGGQMFWLGNGRYEIVRMPVEVSNKNLLDERISFTDENARQFITVGHELLSDLADLTLKNFGDVLKRGAIFIDESAETFRLIFFVTTKIVDGLKRSLSEKLHAFEVSTDGKIFSTDATLNYRSATAVEREQILSTVKNLGNVESLAVTCAEKFFVPKQLQAVTDERIPLLDKSEAAINLRRQREISFLDLQAGELSATDKLNAEKISRQADELDERFKRRLARIKLERNFSAETKLLAAALIVPTACLADENFSEDADSRARVEELAMQAVMTIERELGNSPVDVSSENRGYDIESRTPAGQRRFIEVKGRRADATTVTVTRNEIFAALQSPEKFILAVVAVAEKISVTYLQKPFAVSPDPAAASVNFKISALLRQGIITLTRNISVDS